MVVYSILSRVMIHLSPSPETRQVSLSLLELSRIEANSTARRIARVVSKGVRAVLLSAAFRGLQSRNVNCDGSDARRLNLRTLLSLPC
jgi:hypothetical protein